MLRKLGKNCIIYVTNFRPEREHFLFIIETFNYFSKFIHFDRRLGWEF